MSNLIKSIDGELFEISQHALERLMIRWNMGNGEEEKAWRKIMVKFNDEHVYEYEKVMPDPDFIERYFYSEREMSIPVKRATDYYLKVAINNYKRMTIF